MTPPYPRQFQPRGVVAKEATEADVERVARAICLKNCEDPDEPDFSFLSDKVQGKAWEGYIPHARAALRAMGYVA